MHRHQIQSVIIEGGRQTLQTFIDANLWDEARIFSGNTIFTQGISAPTLPESYRKKKLIGQDELIISRNHD
jgi:diaminohydroxyphosphoribosylaminopyrimidine deaminase/5-amino-6-(5-phosphoribosylamino)uracil reductase